MNRRSGASIVDWHALEAGLYQVATPADIHVADEPVVLREADHFWIDRQWDAKTKTERVQLRTGTDGLRIQADALGVHVISRIVEMSQRYCRAEATGYRLRPDGFLEVYGSVKEYDLTAELAKAALKALPRDEEGRPAAQTQALVKVDSEGGALALVSTLPPGIQARVMQARLEVQSHRLGLCETKAANRVLRYFIGKGGGVLKAQPGCKEVKITLRHAVLIRRLDPDAMRAVTESLYPTTQPIEPEVVEEPDDEDARVMDEEAADEAEALADEQADNGGAEDEMADEPPEEAAASESGGEPANQAPGEPSAPTPAPAPDDIVPCHDCAEPVSPKCLAYCQSARGRQEFAGQNLCFRCQGARRKQKGGGA